jgi:predicted transcriptional regulator
MKKNQKVSVAEKIIKIIDKRPRTAEEIREKLKDKFGFNIKLEDVRVNLLYLLRRGKINREKENKIYKYYI